MLRRIIAVLAIAAAVATVASIALAGPLPPLGEQGNVEQGPTRAELLLIKQKRSTLRKRIHNNRRATWRWQDVTLTPHSGKKGRPELRIKNLQRLRRVSKLWVARKKRARHKALNPPHKAEWLCLYKHEKDPRQGWSTNTGNGFYGGLQFKQSTWVASDGLRFAKRADLANPHEQMWAAEKTLAAAGSFQPWPNTARMCGLL